MSEKQFKLKIRVNGVSNAFMREVGCDCSECKTIRKRAQTSVSLLLEEVGQPDRHILFDCGSHVVDSVIDAGIVPPEAIFLSHEHMDHVGGVDRMVWCSKRNFSDDKIKLYSSRETLIEGPKKLFSNLPVDYVECEPFVPIELDFGSKLFLTPVKVYHGPNVKEPVIWVVEYWDWTVGGYKKFVLGWDLLHFVPRYEEEDHDDNYSGAVISSTAFLGEHRKLFDKVEHLFLAGNTSTSHPETGHMSIDSAFRFLLPAMNPLNTLIVHYSGHEDESGPMSEGDLKDWIEEQKEKYELPNLGISVAHYGMEIEL
jgi:ribonuclease BN (tRNA processing enzyme)